MKKFWLVWNPAAKAPVVEHETLEAARAEAKRIALKHPGCAVYVLSTVGFCKTLVPPVTWTECTEEP